jgi:hypothetical protein
MTENCPPSSQKFIYELKHMPLCFVRPTNHILNEFKLRHNSLTRLLFKNIRNNDSADDVLFSDMSMTTGEFSIVFLRARNRL